MKQLLILFIGLMSFLVFADDQENWLSYSLDCQVLTEDGTGFSKDITAWTEEVGGYYTSLSPQQVLLRFPWQELSNFRDWLDLNTREIYRLDQSSQDLREDILNLQSGIEARSEVLQRNMEYLDKSNLEGTLALEQEIRRLMMEIDTRQGQLRRRENDRRMVIATVNISFLTNSLPEREYSSFPWVNTVDFFDFVAGYSPDRLRLKRVPFSLPEGFALEQRGNLWRGITPEGIRLQLRWVKNYPKMELPFWEEVMREDFSQRGYLSLGEAQRIPWATSGEISLSDWGVPYGREDYRYLMGLMVKGDSILILETAGPVLMMDEYLPRIIEELEGS